MDKPLKRQGPDQGRQDNKESNGKRTRLSDWMCEKEQMQSRKSKGKHQDKQGVKKTSMEGQHPSKQGKVQWTSKAKDTRPQVH